METERRNQRNRSRCGKLNRLRHKFLIGCEYRFAVLSSESPGLMGIRDLGEFKALGNRTVPGLLHSNGQGKAQDRSHPALGRGTGD